MDFNTDKVMTTDSEDLRKYLASLEKVPETIGGEPLVVVILRKGCVPLANLQILREFGADILRRDANGRNGLMTLLRHFYVPRDYFSELLRAFSWNLDEKDENGRTIAHYSAAVPEVCAMLLESNQISPEARDEFLFTPMHFAAMVNEYDSIDSLHVHGSELDPRDKAGMTPLLRGCLEGALQSVISLLRLGARLDARAEDGMTALHCAALSGKLRMVKYLVEEMKVDLFAVTNMKNTVLHKAAEAGDVEVITYLESKGLDSKALTSIGTDMLQKASFRKLPAVQYFLSKGFSPHYLNSEGDSAVIMAAERGKVKIVKYLHQACSVDLFLADKLGHTALSLAKGERRKAVKDYIEEVVEENWRSRKALLAAGWRLRRVPKLA